MKASDVVPDYYPTQTALAEALGIKQQSVVPWFQKKGKIPRLRQFEIALLTGGKLKVDSK